MQHLDESTIHAWLDGALDADEAARVERHARECATCAAAVAEARGLVAGASRILGALDQTPGGVIPASPPSLGAAKTPRSVWRVLHFTPVRAAAAALVIVAAGTVLVMRHAPNGSAANDTGQMMVSHGPPPPPAQAMDTIMEPKVPAPTPSSPSPAAGRRVDRASATAQAPAKEALPVPTPRFGQLAERSATAAAPRAAALPADTAPVAKSMAVATSPLAASNAAPAPAGAAGFVGGAAPARARAADRLSQITATAMMDVQHQPVAALAGCYDVVADSAAALPHRIVLDSLPAEAGASLESRRVDSAAAARKLRILDAAGAATGYWERIDGNAVRLSIAQSGASPLDLHVVSPTTLAGTKTIGNRVVAITLNRAAHCSAR